MKLDLVECAQWAFARVDFLAAGIAKAQARICGGISLQIQGDLVARLGVEPPVIDVACERKAALPHPGHESAAGWSFDGWQDRRAGQGIVLGVFDPAGGGVDNGELARKRGDGPAQIVEQERRRFEAAFAWLKRVDWKGQLDCSSIDQGGHDGISRVVAVIPGIVGARGAHAVGGWACRGSRIQITAGLDPEAVDRDRAGKAWFGQSGGLDRSGRFGCFQGMSAEP